MHSIITFLQSPTLQTFLSWSRACQIIMDACQMSRSLRSTCQSWSGLRCRWRSHRYRSLGLGPCCLQSWETSHHNTGTWNSPVLDSKWICSRCPPMLPILASTLISCSLNALNWIELRGVEDLHVSAFARRQIGSSLRCRRTSFIASRLLSGTSQICSHPHLVSKSRFLRCLRPFGKVSEGLSRRGRCWKGASSPWASRMKANAEISSWILTKVLSMSQPLSLAGRLECTWRSLAPGTPAAQSPLLSLRPPVSLESAYLIPLPLSTPLGLLLESAPRPCLRGLPCWCHWVIHWWTYHLR